MANKTSLRAMLGPVICALCVATPVLAQEWGLTKPIRIVVPDVGGTNDAHASLIAVVLRKARGRTAIGDSNGGGGGLIGTTEVALSVPDWPILLMRFNGPISFNSPLYPKLTYRPQEDLISLARAATTPQVLAGNKKVVAITGRKRFPSLSDMPTMMDRGYPGYVATSWIGFFASAGTPKQIIDRHNQEIVKIAKELQIRNHLEQMELEIVGGDSKEFVAWIQEDAQR